MNSKLSEYLALRDYNDVAEKCAAWIRGWFAENGPDSPAVIGISGGKDSSVIAALCVKALGKERVFGVLMPDGVQPDIDVAEDLVRFLDIPHAVVNIHDAVAGLKASVAGAGIEPSGQMAVNIPPRIRMTALYAVSQCMNGRVSNNSNRSERYVGYSTLFGDSAGDFSPLSNLTVTEVVELGRRLGLPERFVCKPPSDGLTGRTDEDSFGFTYEDLDSFILTGSCGSAEAAELIAARHRANLFKLRPMPAFSPD